MKGRKRTDAPVSYADHVRERDLRRAKRREKERAIRKALQRHFKAEVRKDV